MTLVLEGLLLACLVVVLAALVGPKYSMASFEAQQDRHLAAQLRTLRQQLLQYRAEHRGIAPGYPPGYPDGYSDGDTAPPPSAEAFLAQMTRYTDDLGHSSATPSQRYRLGPYLFNIPANPVSGSSTFRVIPDDQAFPVRPTGGAGWVYRPASGEIAADTPGHDARGTDYFDY